MASPALRAEFAPSGTLVAGTNFGNPVIAQRDPSGGEPRGVGPSLARELARRLGVPIRYAVYDTAGKMADAAKEGAWDVAFLAVDPARATDIGFSAPYVLIEGTYLVRGDSPFRSVDDVDREGVRIAVADKSAYHLFLMRHVQRAGLVAFAKDSSVRLVDGAYMSIGQAAGVPRTRANAASYLRDFIEEAKASGFVARALAESGIHDATVAPAAR
jgi:polar amino acid transport system substrate-binding protein